ncbi:hypothetical protein ACFQVD_41760 [Streptosporangium amethystogenes subsp. fukuiense]|uniref:Phosphotyrosine protein phosphatase I domain-containing protein n=1 Tax=Streptosporangium amethystogenes subsp. fukuiense TaxID=698418 RepID=A0ABW2TF56_9ACTN
MRHDLTGDRLFPKPVTDDALQAADVIVLLGPVSIPLPSCDRSPAQQVLRWDIPDLDGQPYEALEAARDDLNRRALLLMADLLRPQPGAETGP